MAADRRKHVLELYDAGNSQRAIAEQLGMPPATVALDLKMSPGYKPRRTLARFKPGVGRITAQEAAEAHGLKLATLCAAIDAKRVRGRRHKLAGGRIARTVDPAELEEDLANLPTCGHHGCDRRALAPGGGCCGPHSRAIATRGRKMPVPVARKIREAKKAKPRPDVRERVAAMHADKEQRYRWNVALAEGRARISTPEAATLMKRRSKGRLGGFLKGGRTEGALSYWNLDARAKLAVARAEFESEHGKQPTVRRLAELTGIPKSTVSRLSQ
jgi:hypothetical protein